MQERFVEPVPSPCVSLCKLDEHGYCEGCLRHVNEIARWLSMDSEERRHLMETELPQREIKRA